MTSRAVDQPFYEFGPFRLDPTERLLVRDGQPVPLTPKAFDLLVYLVEHQGRLVEKQALLSALWPDTVVEEVNLAYNISALRKVLDGKAEGTSMIQTVPTRGYRFVAPVRSSGPPTAGASGDVIPENGGQHGRTKAWTRGSGLMVFVVGIFAAAAVTFFWMTRLHDRSTSEPGTAPKLERLTANPPDLLVTSAQISPDGRYLAYADPTGVGVRTVDTGETHRLPETKGMNVYGWSPDSADVLASQCGPDECSGWSISLIGQERRRTGAVWPVRDRAKAEPSGRRLLRLAESGTLTVDPMNGAPVRQLADGFISAANWSADGTHVLFVRDGLTIESVPAEGGKAIEVFRAQKQEPISDVLEPVAGTVFMAMMPPATAFSTAGPEVKALWKFHTDKTGAIRGSPQRLTFTSEKVTDLSASHSGARVVFRGTSSQDDVYVASCDFRSGVMEAPRRLTVDDRDDAPFDWMPDNTTILLTSTRNGAVHIFKQRLDSDVAEPFVTGPGSQYSARVTSDGRWVLYLEVLSHRVRTMRVPLTGGTPELVVDRALGDLQCAAKGRCVLVQNTEGAVDFKDGMSSTIWSLDPVRGRDRELGHFPAVASSTTHVLPNGDAFAYVVPQDKGPLNVVRVISFTGKPAQDIVVQQATKLLSLDWLPSDSGFLTTDHGKLLLVRRSGASRLLWSPPAPLQAWWAIPSPDERHLAIDVSSEHSNVWMVSGF
jgi:DNA-binding winged helix-turn-helix (wHTH) protein